MAARIDTDGEDLTAKAYRSLRRMIVDGKVRPRQRLSHRTLSRDLGIGRSPVRDALLQLESEGLIEHRPSSGIYLREVTPAELECIYELRIVNEPYAAGRAAERADAGQVSVLRRNCEEMAAIAGRSSLEQWFSRVENRRRFCRLDMDFHSTVLHASGNPLAAKLFANAQLLALTFAWDLGYGRPEWFAGIVSRTAAGHRSVFEAIRDRDQRGARSAMLEHVSWAQEEVPGHYAVLRGDASRDADPTARHRRPAAGGSRGP